MSNPTIEISRRLNPRFVYQIQPHEGGEGYIIGFSDTVDGDCVADVLNKEELKRLAQDILLTIGDFDEDN